MVSAMNSPLGDWIHYALDRLEHFSTVVEFYQKFAALQGLLLQVKPGLPEDYLATRFVYGLRSDYQIFVLRFHPVTVLAAYRLAAIYEESTGIYVDKVQQNVLGADHLSLLSQPTMFTDQMRAFLHDALDKIDHISTVEAYFNSFEPIRQLVFDAHPWLTEEYFMSRFVYGLKEEYQNFILRFQPTTIRAAYRLALIFEESIYLHYFPELECSQAEMNVEKSVTDIPLDATSIDRDRDVIRVEEEVVYASVDSSAVIRQSQALTAVATYHMDGVSIDEVSTADHEAETNQSVLGIDSVGEEIVVGDYVLDNTCAAKREEHFTVALDIQEDAEHAAGSYPGLQNSLAKELEMGVIKDPKMHPPDLANLLVDFTLHTIGWVRVIDAVQAFSCLQLRVLPTDSNQSSSLLILLGLHLGTVLWVAAFVPVLGNNGPAATKCSTEAAMVCGVEGSVGHVTLYISSKLLSVDRSGKQLHLETSSNSTECEFCVVESSSGMTNVKRLQTPLTTTLTSVRHFHWGQGRMWVNNRSGSFLPAIRQLIFKWEPGIILVSFHMSTYLYGATKVTPITVFASKTMQFDKILVYVLGSYTSFRGGFVSSGGTLWHIAWGVLTATLQSPVVLRVSTVERALHFQQFYLSHRLFCEELLLLMYATCPVIVPNSGVSYKGYTVHVLLVLVLAATPLYISVGIGGICSRSQPCAAIFLHVFVQQCLSISHHCFMLARRLAMTVMQETCEMLVECIVREDPLHPMTHFMASYKSIELTAADKFQGCLLYEAWNCVLLELGVSVRIVVLVWLDCCLIGGSSGMHGELLEGSTSAWLVSLVLVDGIWQSKILHSNSQPVYVSAQWQIDQLWEHYRAILAGIQWFQGVLMLLPTYIPNRTVEVVWQVMGLLFYGTALKIRLGSRPSPKAMPSMHYNKGILVSSILISIFAGDSAASTNFPKHADLFAIQFKLCIFQLDVTFMKGTSAEVLYVWCFDPGIRIAYESISELNSSPSDACVLMGFDCNCKNHKVAFSTWFFHMEELSPMTGNSPHTQWMIAWNSRMGFRTLGSYNIAYALKSLAVTVIIPALTDYAFGISHWIVNAFDYSVICVSFGVMVPTRLASHLHMNSILSSKEEDRGGTIRAHHASVLAKSECLHTLKNVSIFACCCCQLLLCVAWPDSAFENLRVVESSSRAAHSVTSNLCFGVGDYTAPVGFRLHMVLPRKRKVLVLESNWAEMLFCLTDFPWINKNQSKLDTLVHTTPHLQRIHIVLALAINMLGWLLRQWWFRCLLPLMVFCKVLIYLLGRCVRTWSPLSMS